MKDKFSHGVNGTEIEGVFSVISETLQKASSNNVAIAGFTLIVGLAIVAYMISLCSSSQKMKLGDIGANAEVSQTGQNKIGFFSRSNQNLEAGNVKSRAKVHQKGDEGEHIVPRQ